MHATIRGAGGLAAMMIALFSGVSSAVAVDTMTTRSATAGNPAGLWSNTMIWSAGQVPTNVGATTWHVIIPSGVPITQVDGDYTINRLDLSGSIIESLDAGHLLTVVNELNVNGGIFRGPGTTLTQGQTTWASNAQINTNHVLQNSGPFSVVDFLIIQSGGLFENLLGGVVTLQSDGGARAIGGANRNAGTYNLSVTSPFGSVSVSEMETTATGVVNVLSGPVSLTNLRQQAGTFNIASTASVSLANNNPATISVFTAASSLNAPAGSSVTLSGLSRLRIEGGFNAAGSVTASAQEVEWTSIPQNVGQTFAVSSFSVARFSGGMPAMNQVSVAGGTLTGLGNHQISGTLTGSGTGVLAGNGTSTLASGNSASGNLTIDQRKLVIAAGATSTLSATLINNGELQNLGTVTNADFLRTSLSTGTFRNDASYNVTSNLHRVDAIFAGSGTTTIANGATLAIERDASGAQQFIINGSLTLGTTSPFAPVGTRTFDAGSSFAGPGNLTFGRGTTTIAGNFAPGGPVTVDGGTATFTSAVNTISALRAGFPFSSGGTFNFNGGLAQVGTLQLGDSGVLNITGNTTVTGTADFIRATHGGSGITTVQGMAALSGTFDGRQVDFQNNVVPAGGGFSLTNNATIRVAPGAGRFNLDGFNVNVTGFGATPGQLVNAGVIDNTHPSFPNDTFLFRVDVPFVQEATGRIDNGHDIEFRRTVNAAGSINLISAQARLLAHTTVNGVIQNFTGLIDGLGSIDVAGPTGSDDLRVNFNGGIELNGTGSTLSIQDADVQITLPSTPNTVELATHFQLNGDASLELSSAVPVTVIIRGSPSLGLGNENNGNRPAGPPGNGRSGVTGVGGQINQLGAVGGSSMIYDQGEFHIAGFFSLGCDLIIGEDATIIQEGAIDLEVKNNASFKLRGIWDVNAPTNVVADPAATFVINGTLSVRASGLVAANRPIRVNDEGTLHLAASNAPPAPANLAPANFPVFIQGDVDVEGSDPLRASVKIGDPLGGAKVVGDLRLGSFGQIEFELSGTQQGVNYDFLDLDGSLTITGGLLELTFLNGFHSQVQSPDVFTLLDADSPIIGSFTNVPSGGQLLTSDGLGLFNVYYGAGSPYGGDLLVVTNFMVPEPSAVTLIMFGGTLSVRRRRRG